MTLDVLITAIKAIGFPVVRNLGGWFNKAFEDGKLEAYEWIEGAHTLFRVLILQTLIYFAIPLFGADPNLLAAGAAAALVDTLFGFAKKLKAGVKKKKK